MKWGQEFGAPVIRLPYLRGKMAEKAFPANLNVVRLWPGLPDAPENGWHKPRDYPLAPDMARKLLTELEALDVDYLQRAQNRAAVWENRCLRRDEEELEDLRIFECGETRPPNGKSDAPARLEAQKFLLWIWVAQGRAHEIAQLAEKFAQGAAEFTRALARGEDIPPEPCTGSLALDESIWPSWKSVLVNALYFLPEKTAVFVEGKMRGELMELFEFDETDYDEIVFCSANVADILEMDESRLPKSHKRKLSLLAFV